MLVIMISAKQGGGKSTLADALENHFISTGFHARRLKFADSLYEMQRRVLSVLTEQEIPVEDKYGELLQFLGTDFGRKIFGEDIWAKILLNKVLRIPGVEKNIVIVDDMRFKNEFAVIPSAIKIRLECDREIRKSRTHSWRENDTHQSEIDLDEYVEQKKFDLVIDTGIHDKNFTFNMALKKISERELI